MTSKNLTGYLVDVLDDLSVNFGVQAAGARTFSRTISEF